MHEKMHLFFRPSGGRLEKQVILIWEKNMTYTKPQIIAQNSSSGSYAAGCPGEGPFRGPSDCNACNQHL